MLRASSIVRFQVIKPRPVNKYNAKQRQKRVQRVNDVLRELNVAPGKHNKLPKQRRLRDIARQQKIAEMKQN